MTSISVEIGASTTVEEGASPPSTGEEVGSKVGSGVGVGPLEELPPSEELLVGGGAVVAGGVVGGGVLVGGTVGSGLEDDVGGGDEDVEMSLLLDVPRSPSAPGIVASRPSLPPPSCRRVMPNRFNLGLFHNEAWTTHRTETANSSRASREAYMACLVHAKGEEVGKQRAPAVGDSELKTSS